MADINPTLASNEQAIRDEADRNRQNVDAAVAAVHQSSVNTPPNPADVPFDPNAANAPAVAFNENLDEISQAALKLFNDHVTRVLEVFEDYRSKAQAGNLTAEDEKRAGAALKHLRAIVETHKPLPPLPHVLHP